MSDNKKKKAGLGFAVWFLLFLGVFILILINWKTISSNFNDLKNVVQGSRTEQQERKEEIAARKAEEKAKRAAEKDAKEYARAQEKEQGGVTITLGGDKSAESNSASEKNQAQEETKKEESSQEQVNSESKPESKGESNSETKTESSDEKRTSEKTDSGNNQAKAEENKKTSAEEKNNSAAATQTVTATRNTKLYFLKVAANGTTSIMEVTRVMAKSDSPLTDALNAVISGPNSKESAAGCQSYISSGTKLLSASVKNGIATLNFNENLAYNSFGIAGLNAELEQIVYTATAFSTVDSVQILVEGKLTDYLSEGVWIGTPLKRSSF